MIDDSDWDSIINIEQDIFSIGVSDGEKFISGFMDPTNVVENNDDFEVEDSMRYQLSKSFNFGFMKGFSIGIELGYMKSSVSQLISEKLFEDSTERTCESNIDYDSTLDNDDNSLSALNHNNDLIFTKNSEINSNNNYNKGPLNNLLKKINEIPLVNSNDIDFEKEILKLRSIHKQFCKEKYETLEYVISNLSSTNMTPLSNQKKISYEW